MKLLLNALGLLAASALLGACLGGADSTDSSSTPRLDLREAQANMVGVWSTAPYGPYPLGPLTQENIPLPGAPELASFPGDQAVNRSFRMIINPTLGGQAVRLRLSNLVGTQPVRFENISIAKGNPLLPNIDESTRVPLTVNGRDFGVAMPGQELITDVAEFAFNSQEDLAITFHVAGESGPMTWHAVSFGPQYISPHNSGDVTHDSLGTSFSQVSVGWFFLSGLDAFNPQTKGAVVAIGDSITDGFLQVLNQRWTDRLAMRLNAQNANVAILNQGINSNTVTAARSGFAGPPLLERFRRDVLEQPGVKGVIIFEGTNDLGAGVKAEPVIQAYQQLIQQARSNGLCVFMGTIPPRADVAFGWLPDGPTVKEPERQKINTWIRSTPLIDGVVDFDEVLALPGIPLPNAALFIPDLLHPNSLGFTAMGDEVNIDALLTRCNLN